MAMGLVIFQICVLLIGRRLSFKTLKKNVLGGNFPLKKASLEMLRANEDKRYSMELDKYNAELDKLEKTYSGIKALNYDLILFNRNLFLKEINKFSDVLVEIIKECNMLNTKQWWKNMGADKFEKEVANWFCQKGYNADVTQFSGDGGVDIVLEKNGIREFVQCKHYLNQKVQVATVRELFGVMASEKVSKGYIVSILGLTQGAFEFALKNNIKSISLNELSVDYKNTCCNLEVKMSGYYDQLLNRYEVGACVGDCFIYGDIFNDFRIARESLENRNLLEDQWAFILSLKNSYYSSDYYVVVRCPLYMKNDILHVRKVIGKCVLP